MLRTLIIVFLALATSLVAAPVALAQQDGEIIVVPGDPDGLYQPPSVDIGATSPGAPGGSGSGNAARASASGRQPVCTYVPAAASSSKLGSLYPNNRLPSDSGDGLGEVAYYLVCDGVGVGWASALPSGGVVPAAAALPTPGQLAQEAYARLTMPAPVARHSPDVRLRDGRSSVIVGENTWIWVEPGVFGPRSERVQAGPVWAEVTAAPTSLTFTPGDGHPAVTCGGPGTPYDRARFGVHAASPDCGYVYRRSSYGMPGDQVSATYAITWHVTWTGSTGAAPAGGSLPAMRSETTIRFAVAEVQGLRSG